MDTGGCGGRVSGGRVNYLQKGGRGMRSDCSHELFVPLCCLLWLADAFDSFSAADAHLLLARSSPKIQAHSWQVAGGLDVCVGQRQSGLQILRKSIEEGCFSSCPIHPLILFC